MFVINPFVSKCDLSNTLKETGQNSVTTYLITRKSKDDDYSAEEKRNYLETLKDSGVKLFFNKDVHAKLIIVDRVVDIASSMNFYPTASSGKSWEAGLVTIEPTVIENMVGSVLELVDDNDTHEVTSLDRFSN